MNQTATYFQVALGDTVDNGGDDFGVFGNETPEAALAEAVRDSDPTRLYEAPVLLSTNPTHGRGAPRSDGNGHGGADRSGWWYVTDETGALRGIYSVSAVVHVD